MVFQRVKRCSQAGRKGQGTAPSEFSACVEAGESYMLLVSNLVSVEYNSKWGQGKQGQLRKTSHHALRSGGAFLKVQVAKGGSIEGF